MLQPKRRKKRFPEAELLARLRRYEEHLRGYGADIDAINSEEGLAPAKRSLAVQMNAASLVASVKSNDAIRSLSVRRSLKHVKKLG